MKKITIILGMMLLQINLFAQISSVDLIAKYPFNGTFNDESGNGNNGTANNGVSLTTNRFGLSDRAIAFDGVDDYLDIGTMNELNINLQNFSLSFWIKSDTTNKTNFEQVIGTINAGMYSTAFVVEINREYLSTGQITNNYSPNFISLYIRDANANVFSLSTYKSELFDNNWHLITFVVNDISNNLGDIYIDNILVNSNSQQGSPSNFATYDYSLAVGANNLRGVISYFYEGSLDDIKFYKKSLTTSEINDIYNENLCLSTTYDTTFVTVTDTLLIDIATGFSQPNEINTIKVFPNPANNQLNIYNGNYTLLNNYKIEIKNSLGQQMFYNDINTQMFNIDISQWTTGLYFVNVLDSNNQVIDTKKIVLQ